MSEELTLIRVVPAYGRDYRSKERAVKDWKENIDFKVVWGPNSGKPINRIEANELGFSIQIRYWRHSRLTEIIYPEPSATFRSRGKE